MEKARVGFIGVGNIFPRYVNAARRLNILEPVACTDIRLEIAQARAAEVGLEVRTVDELLGASDIDVIINLTIPAAHAQVDLQVIEAGKHVYTEKPLGISTQEGRAVLEAAEKAGVRVGSAPDTFLGGGIQTCRKLIDDGWIGEPIAATAFFASRGPESWHPNPEIFYRAGAGPLFDMGPYYITTLVFLLGAVSHVSAATRRSFAQRVATSEARFGSRIDVDVPTHSAGLLRFASGPIATMITSFDIWKHNLPRIEIYGSLGTLQVPDPNTFGGPIRLWLHNEGEWRDVPLAYNADVERSIGAADMMQSIRDGLPHRASGALAYHVLEVMEAFDKSSQTGSQIAIESAPAQPPPLPLGLLPGDVGLR